MPVAEFYADVMIALKELGLEITINPMPSEIADCIPFDQDTMHASYDADYANRFWRVLLRAHEVFAHFRTGFLGKDQPGAFLLGQLRSGGDAVFRAQRAAPSRRRAASARRGGAGGLFARGPSAGFWPGGGAIDYPAFYSYAYPAPEGFAAAKVKPAEAFFSKELGEFILPYDAVRNARDPDSALMEFLQSTYEAAADLAKWDRAALECGSGRSGKVRAV